MNKKQMSIQEIVNTELEIDDGNARTWWFEETFLIADIPQPAV